MGILKFMKTRSYNSDPGTIIQETISNTEAGYSKQSLIEAISRMSNEQFQLFCNDIRVLQNFYDSNQGSWVTDDMSKIPPEYRSHFYMLR